jgi:hypothetical protein
VTVCVCVCGGGGWGGVGCWPGWGWGGGGGHVLFGEPAGIHAFLCSELRNVRGAAVDIGVCVCVGGGGVQAAYRLE